MARRAYTAEFKAAVVVEWKAGESLRALARKHSLPVATLKGWLDGHDRTSLRTASEPKKGSVLDDLAIELVKESLAGVIAIYRHAQDKEWLNRQDAGPLAIFLGVSFDKLARLQAAYRPEGAE